MNLPNDFAARRAALLTLLRRLSYEERPVTLSSGQPSHFYIDCKQTVLTGEGHVLIGACFAELLGTTETTRRLAPHAAVGGLTMGADPLASATSLWSTLHGRPLDAIYVRKRPRGTAPARFSKARSTCPTAPASPSSKTSSPPAMPASLR